MRLMRGRDDRAFVDMSRTAGRNGRREGASEGQRVD